MNSVLQKLLSELHSESPSVSVTAYFREQREPLLAVAPSTFLENRGKTNTLHL